MKIQDIINETTSAGGIASFAVNMPPGPSNIVRRKKGKKGNTLLASADKKPVPKVS